MKKYTEFFYLLVLCGLTSLSLEASVKWRTLSYSPAEKAQKEQETCDARVAADNAKEEAAQAALQAVKDEATSVIAESKKAIEQVKEAARLAAIDAQKSAEETIAQAKIEAQKIANNAAVQAKETARLADMQAKEALAQVKEEARLAAAEAKITAEKALDEMKKLVTPVVSQDKDASNAAQEISTVVQEPLSGELPVTADKNDTNLEKIIE
jgi:hypothetical protein